MRIAPSSVVPPQRAQTGALRCSPPRLAQVSQNEPAPQGVPRGSLSRGTNALLVAPVMHLGDGVLSLGLRTAGFTPLDVGTPLGTVRLWDAPGQDPNGPVMVVLHGMAGSAAEMSTPLSRMQAFAQRVIAVETPSHGNSFSLGEQHGDMDPAAPPHACLESMVSAVNAAIEAVLDGPAVLCGHSLGGYLAARYVLAQPPGHPLRLQLVDTDGAPWTDEETAAGRRLMDVRTRRAASALAHRTFPTRPTRAFLYTHFIWARFATPQVRYLVHSDAFQPVLSPAQLGALPADTLLIRGQHEAFNAPHTLSYLHGHLPQGSQLSQPETGHGDIACADPALMAVIENHACRAAG